MLGTGNALVTKYYNTCFTLSERGKYFLVDAGGGNGILTQLEKAKINWKDIKDIFISHKHTDHLLGVIWLIRVISYALRDGKYEGEVNIYGHEEVIGIIRDISNMLLVSSVTKFLDDRIKLVVLNDGDCKNIIGHKVRFFDINSTKTKQFGFSMNISNSGSDERLTFCGDEPYSGSYGRDSRWLLHEAYCLYEEKEIFKPYEKFHSTVKDAAMVGDKLKVKNLLLYHTEDKNVGNRKKLYTKEGSKYYSGNLHIPEDLEKIKL